MRKLTLLLACLALTRLCLAQADFAVDKIPKELLAYAGAVVRTDETVVKIKEKDNVDYHFKIAITVLNSSGDKYAVRTIFHNKLWAIKSIKGAIYNELGKPFMKISEADFEDNYYDDGFSLFQDAKFKSYSPHLTQYPYTVEYEYNLNSKQNLDIDSWYATTGTNIAVQSSSCLMLAKPDIALNYKQINYSGTAKTGVTDGMNSWYWHVENQKAIRPEAYSLPEKNFTTHVDFAPADFIYDGVSGSFKSWEDLGKWTYTKLLAGRQQLTPQTEEEIKDLVRGLTTDKEKAKKIYEYMQSKCRYVSIQIGIGGYRPFAASEVDMLGYGDCKGLVNYTSALLKVANIDSYYCVVEAGREKTSMMPDFASMNQGNHIILCLPFKSDTTWLECTSKHIPFGFLGAFTDDRTVLACTPQGGKLLHTPKYTATQNKEDKTAELSLLNNGTITGNMTSLFTGTQYEYRDYLVGTAYQDQIKDITKAYPVNNMEIEALRFEPQKKELPVIKEIIKFNAPEYASVENGRMIFLVNAANRIGTQLKESRNRISPLHINRGFTDDEKIVYTLPEGYNPDTAPLEVNISKKYGSYKATTTTSGNKLTYIRRFQLLDGTYSKDDYNDFAEFYQSVYDADHYTVTLIKK